MDFCGGDRSEKKYLISYFIWIPYAFIFFSYTHSTPVQYPLLV